MPNMTCDEFYEKYKNVEFYLDSYFKYTFTFLGNYEGKLVSVSVGGNSEYIYKEDFTVGSIETIKSLQPYEGSCDGDSFYDY